MADKIFRKKYLKLLTEYKDLMGSNSAAFEIFAMREQLYVMTEEHIKENCTGKSKFTDQPPPITLGNMELILEFINLENHEDRIAVFYERCMPLLQILSDLEHRVAMSRFAYMLAWTNGQTPHKYKKVSKARLIFEKLTKCNDPLYAGFAHSQLAQLYIGSQEELNKVAIEHAEKSAYKFNSAYGQHVLGEWYLEGEFVPKDIKKGFGLIERGYQSAVNSDRYSVELIRNLQFLYGWSKYYGIGCAEDQPAGRNLLIQAAESGFPAAIDWLKDMSHRTDSENSKNNESSDNPMEPFASSGKSARINKAATKIKNKKELEKLLDPLHAMIGCGPVKREVESLIFLAYTNALRLKKKIDTAPLSLHAAFLGSPGTGKTTVARMYSQILFDLGYLTKGHVVEVSRADLVAEYVGQTAPLVRSKVEEAIGGILFVDEAYSLSMHDYGWDFGAEAIAELIQQMENRRENLVVVFAGYTDEMHMFLKSNPGLRSRVPNVIEFPDYTPEEMVKIFNKMCKENNYTATKDAQDRVLKYLKKQDKETIRRMGNARGVRNIFEESIVHQARRLFHSGKTSKKALITLEGDDIMFPDDPSPKHLRVIKDSKE